jgi:hypothetical protein
VESMENLAESAVNAPLRVAPAGEGNAVRSGLIELTCDKVLRGLRAGCYDACDLYVTGLVAMRARILAASAH